MITELKNFKLSSEFDDIQYKSWEIAKILNPESIKFGFNINSSYQCEIYKKDDGVKDTMDSGDLTWKNFIDLFPSYLNFCKKYNFYPGCTMISNYITYPHRHGRGEHTLTYPWANCDGIEVYMITPININELNDKDIHTIKSNNAYNIDLTYTTKTGIPFILKADHFHTTDKKNFHPGKTIFTVWHHLDVFTHEDVINTKKRYEL